MSASNSERRELAARLRDLRETAGLSTTRLAAMLGWSQSKVSKIELGRTKPAISDVEAWLDAVGAPTDQRAELLDMAESIQVASIIWNRTLVGGRAEHQRTIGRLRDQAAKVRVFQHAVVPGLLQTADYARRVLALGDVFGLGDTASAAAARVERQASLYDESRSFEFIVTEAALRFRAGPASTLKAQYDKILSIFTLPTVTLGVIPTDADVSMVHAHSFVLYESADEGKFVAIETYTRELALTDPDEVGTYESLYGRLRADALHGDEARAFIAAIQAQT